MNGWLVAVFVVAAFWAGFTTAAILAAAGRADRNRRTP